MKKFILAGALLATMAAAAQAQGYGPPQGTWRSGVGGGGSTSGPPQGSWSGPGWGWGGGWGGWSGGYGYGTWYGYPYHPYGNSYHPYSYRSISPDSYAPIPRLLGRAVADRPAELEIARRIERGRARFKAADYRGALDEFREAVIADATSGAAQAHFALALIVAGDGRHADKALRAAAERMPFEKIDLPSLLRDEKERARIVAALGRVAGEGALAAAWARMLAGDASRLKEMAEKDPVAKKLLGP